MTADQTAVVEWRDGATPLSSKFDDTYFSVVDGYGESRHVFLAGNHLPARFRPGFHIAELGFGTGLNMLAALIAWTGAGQQGPLFYTGFEAFAMSPEDMSLALRAFPEVAPVAGPFLSAWQKGHRKIEIANLVAEIIPGDARQTLPAWTGHADAWFLDGFSPAKNPEMWEEKLMSAVARHTAAGGTFATYTAAGQVRRSLAVAGFEVSRIVGYANKRHMTTGRLKDQP